MTGNGFQCDSFRENRYIVPSFHHYLALQKYRDKDFAILYYCTMFISNNIAQKLIKSSNKVKFIICQGLTNGGTTMCILEMKLQNDQSANK